MRFALFAVPLGNSFGCPPSGFIGMTSIASVGCAVLSRQIGTRDVEIVVVTHIVAHISAGRHMAHTAIGFSWVALMERVCLRSVLRRVTLQTDFATFGFQLACVRRMARGTAHVLVIHFALQERRIFIVFT